MTTIKITALFRCDPRVPFTKVSPSVYGSIQLIGDVLGDVLQWVDELEMMTLNYLIHNVFWVVLVPWSVGPNCWSSEIFDH